MAELGQRDFSLGWTPDESDVNSRPDGNLKFDNLELSEQGQVRLTRGTSVVEDFDLTASSKVPTSLFSKRIGATVHRLAGFTDGTIKPVGGVNLVPGGGSGQTPAFGSYTNQVIMNNGARSDKWDGTTLRTLGVETPGAPTVARQARLVKEVGGTRLSYNAIISDSVTYPSGNVEVVTELVTNIASMRLIEAIDGSDLGGTGNADPNDIFDLDVKFQDPSELVNLRIEFSLTALDLPYKFIDSYRVDLKLESDQFDLQTGSWSRIKLKRSDFVRIGTNAALDWSDISEVWLSAEFTSSNILTLGTVMTFTGGSGILSGDYKYLQVNVYDNDKYTAISPAGADVFFVTDRNKVNVTPSLPDGWGTTVNEIWIYRKKLNEIASGGGDVLGDTYHRVAIRSVTTLFEDNLSDVDAALGPIANLFLIHPPIDMHAIAGPYFGRMIYVTDDKIYPSQADNPDAVDSRNILDVSGSSNELNLWVRKVGESSLLIGTTNDIYELSGTGTVLADFTVDFNLRPLGLGHPPISDAVTVYDDTAIYFASDGWRVLSGVSSKSIVGATSLLYRGEARYDNPYVDMRSGNTVTSSCVTTKNQLWCSVALSDGTRRVFVFDLIRQYWRPYFVAPTKLFVEEDGTLLAIFTGVADRVMRILDVGTQLDGTTNQQFNIMSGYLDGGAPLQRKDLGQITIWGNSGGSNVHIVVRADNAAATKDYGNFVLSPTAVLNLKISDADAIHLKHSYQLEIEDVGGAGVAAFELYYWAVTYNARPIPNNHLRVLGSNYGSAGRKRFYEVPFVLDRLANSVVVTPTVDEVEVGAAATTFSGGVAGKTVERIFFTSEQNGHEVGLVIEGTLLTDQFEFYEMLKPEKVQVLPDLVKFYLTPETNLGKSGLKKFVRLAIVINTFGDNVTVTPIIDSVAVTTSTANTPNARTHIHYFTTDVRGTDLQIKLSGATAFEYYTIDLEETVFEILPAPTKYAVLPITNFGSPEIKRIRRIPLVIDTRGLAVDVELLIDNVAAPTVSINTPAKATAFYYITTDLMGVDFEITLNGNGNPFEFYQLHEPTIVEIFPPGKRIDQVGPIIADKVVWFKQGAITVYPTNTSITWELFIDDVSADSGTLTVLANVLSTYEFDFIKARKGRSARIEFASAAIFYRSGGEFRVGASGMPTSLKKIKFDK